jgi:hypothetical protein
MPYYSTPPFLKILLHFYVHSISGRAKHFSFCHLIQTILGPPSPMINGRDMKLTTLIHLALIKNVWSYASIDPYSFTA